MGKLREDRKKTYLLKDKYTKLTLLVSLDRMDDNLLIQLLCK